MALELELVSALVLVTSDPREKQKYKRQGEGSVPDGRFTDAEGRPLSSAGAVVIAEPLGLLGEAQVLLPDVQLAPVRAGMAIKLEGRLTVRLAGRDFGVIAATVTGERITPVGNYVEWMQAAANGKKPVEPRPAS